MPYDLWPNDLTNNFLLLFSPASIEKQTTTKWRMDCEPNKGCATKEWFVVGCCWSGSPEMKLRSSEAIYASNGSEQEAIIGMMGVIMEKTSATYIVKYCFVPWGASLFPTHPSRSSCCRWTDDEDDEEGEWEWSDWWLGAVPASGRRSCDVAVLAKKLSINRHCIEAMTNKKRCKPCLPFLAQWVTECVRNKSSRRKLQRKNSNKRNDPRYGIV